MELIIEKYGCKIIRRDGKFFVRADERHFVVQEAEYEISKQQAEKIMVSEQDAYEVLLSLQNEREKKSNAFAIWTNDDKGSDKLIAYAGNTIYKSNSKNFEQLTFDLKMGNISNELFSIPHHYLKELRLEEKKKYIEVFFGNDSTEHLRIADDAKRKEVFEYLKANIPGSQHMVDKYSIFRAGKKPIIATIVMTAFFGWIYYIANGLEQGKIYEVVGGSGPSFAKLVLGLATIGTTNVIIL
jgi:hypothetical protein